VYTDVEKTMIETQRSTIVQETRDAFQDAMQDKFIGAVEQLLGRKVLAFISNHHVGPDIEIELFLLMPGGGRSVPSVRLKSSDKGAVAAARIGGSLQLEGIKWGRPSDKAGSML
jgi:Na+-translocating membrane potential-generating system (MpsC)